MSIIQLFLVYIFLVLLKYMILTLYCIVSDIHDNKKRAIQEYPNQDLRNGSEINVAKNISSFIFFRVLYGWMRFNIILVGRIPSYYIRNILYRYVFRAKITKKTIIAGGCEIRSPWNLHADNCVIMNNCILDARQGIYLGENVVFGTGVHIWTEEHAINDPLFRVLDENKGAVRIADKAWICSDSTILPGVWVGEGAVLASRACATKNIESYIVAAGIPAQMISERSKDLRYVLSGSPGWFFW